MRAYQTAGGAPYLDYTDTVFGQVYEGMEVVDTIAQAGVDENSAAHGTDHHQQRDHYEIRIRSCFSALRAVGRLQKNHPPTGG